MVLMLCCSFDPFYVGPCPPGCLAPLMGGTPLCGCGPCGGCCSPCCGCGPCGGCSSCPCGW
ncbi:male-specific sperm protein Mst84Db [Drosophila eugracilis]|uniref:male-specific sperm protein Mst84Db n=1 Tax=Drosophila eugracilis TaxID=29029 RepID=UPI0007E7E488|nr:male-specific sperm protein Mst84Db [Drosophila eugracilis]